MNLSRKEKISKTKKILFKLEILHIPSIPSLCECLDPNCNEIVWNKHKFIKGHHNIGKSSAMKGQIPWNKGISFLAGKNHPLYGIPRTKEQKDRQSKAIKGKIPSELTRKIWSEQRKGKGNPNWQGGISFEPYCFKFNNELKEQVRIRDNYTCQLCGNMWKNGRKYTVHHIHYDKINCHPDLICLCNKCNSVVNFNRPYYESLFMNKLNERQLLFWTRRNIE